MDRGTHLQWCKNRALEYVGLGQLEHAIASMKSDLAKHPETNIHQSIEKALDIMILYSPLTKKSVTKWIEGFN
jgi:hypothetical protein